MTAQRIFFVEDDTLMMHVFERLFRLSGFEIEIVVNGEEAMLRLSEMIEKPSVIILDIMMPKVDGLAVLAFIKKTPALSTIPVVILSNAGGKKEADQALALGANNYFIKSEHDPEEFVKQIQLLIGSKENTT